MPSRPEPRSHTVAGIGTTVHVPALSVIALLVITGAKHTPSETPVHVSIIAVSLETPPGKIDDIEDLVSPTFVGAGHGVSTNKSQAAMFPNESVENIKLEFPAVASVMVFIPSLKLKAIGTITALSKRGASADSSSRLPLMLIDVS